MKLPINCTVRQIINLVAHKLSLGVASASMGGPSGVGGVGGGGANGGGSGSTLGDLVLLEVKSTGG